MGSCSARSLSLSNTATAITGCAASTSLTAGGSAGAQDTYGELSAKTRQLIEENTTFIEIARSATGLQDRQGLRDASSTSCRRRRTRRRRLEAILTRELAEDEPGFTYRQLGERLQQLKARKDGDQAVEKRLTELEGIASEAAKTKEEPDRLGLMQPGEYGAFHCAAGKRRTRDESYLADCARRMVEHLAAKVAERRVE